jgi:hypothetical protein
METLVHKTSGGERNLSGNSGSNVQYSSMSNANAPSATQINLPPQVVLPQPAPLAAKPVRDSAQFVSEDARTKFVRIFLLFFQVDLVSAVLFPVAFIVFNIVYW